MGLGILLKGLVPLVLYYSGLIFIFLAMSGNVRPALLAITFLLPLRNFIDRIQNFPLGNQFIDILLLSVIVGWVVRSNIDKKTLFERSYVNAAAIIIFVYMTLSLFWGDINLLGGINFNIYNPRVQDWKNFCLFPIFFAVFLNNLHSKKAIKEIIITISFSIFIVCYYTANQINDYSSLASREKISGTFQFLGPNEVAAFLNANLIILLSLFYSLKNSFLKLFLITLIIISLFCIIFTYSRAAYLGLTFGLGILFWFKDKKLLLPLILLLLFWQSFLPEKVIERINETKTESGELDESSKKRVEIWEKAIDIFKQNPILGIGFGVFRHLGFGLGDTHNIYVKILCEQGLIGFIIFLILIFCFMREGFTLYQKGQDEEDRALGLGFLICIFIVLVNNFFGDRWSYLEPNAYLWIFAALVARLNHIARNPEADNAVKSETKSHLISKASPVKAKKKLRYYDI